MLMKKWPTSAARWPSLLDNTYLLSTTEELGTEAVWRTVERAKGAGTYVLGVSNMQKYRDSSCNWQCHGSRKRP